MKRHEWQSQRLQIVQTINAGLLQSQGGIAIHFLKCKVWLKRVNEHHSLSAKHLCSLVIGKAHNAGDNHLTLAIAIEIAEVHC